MCIDGTVRLINIATGRLVSLLGGPHMVGACSLTFLTCCATLLLLRLPVFSSSISPFVNVQPSVLECRGKTANVCSKALIDALTFPQAYTDFSVGSQNHIVAGVTSSGKLSVHDVRALLPFPVCTGPSCLSCVRLCLPYPLGTVRCKVCGRVRQGLRIGTPNSLAQRLRQSAVPPQIYPSAPGRTLTLIHPFCFTNAVPLVDAHTTEKCGCDRAAGAALLRVALVHRARGRGERGGRGRP